MSELYNKKVIKKMIDDNEILFIDTTKKDSINIMLKKPEEKKESSYHV